MPEGLRPRARTLSTVPHARRAPGAAATQYVLLSTVPTMNHGETVMRRRNVVVGISIWTLMMVSVWWVSHDGVRAFTADYSDWLVKFEDVVTPPVERHETDQVIDAGVIETDGFTHVVLCIGGEMKSRPTQAGKIGVVLVPDMFPFDKALENEGRYLFPIEATGDVTPGGSMLFESQQVRAPVALNTAKSRTRSSAAR